MFVIVEQDALGGAVRVVELAVPERPEEGREPEEAQKKRGRDQVEQPGHRPRPSRRALPTTSSDEPDMQTAAIRGVARPSTATGTAIRL